MIKRVLSGVEVIERETGNSSLRIGLITNPTGQTSSFRPTYDVLAEKFDLRCMFSPEHGVRGSIQAGAEVPEYVDSDTGLPVYSTFGRGKAAAYSKFAELDAVYFDIADIGSRYYTYQYTMTEAMEKCAELGLPFVVLDRPPVIGCAAEGNILDTRHSSFVGKYATAARTGLTIGEFADYINRTEGIGTNLTVIPCENISRDMYFDEYEPKLPFIPPSPNIPTVDTALVYVGTCLIEGTNLSEGRGTTKPFEMLGAPWLRSRSVIERLRALPHDGCDFREVYFTPQFSKHKGELCAGIQLHVKDRRAFRPFETGLRILSVIRETNPEFEYTDFIKNLFGGEEPLNEAFDCEAYISGLDAKLENYRNKIKQSFIY